MPSRRQLLTAGLATASFGSGCLDGRNSGNSEFRDDQVTPPDGDTVVASDERELDGAHGSIRQLSKVTATSIPDDGTLLRLQTVYRVSGGESLEQTEFHEVHDWTVGHSDGTVRDHASNMVYTNRTNPPLAVSDRSSSQTGDWSVELTPPRSSPVTYRFETQFRTTSVSAGDPLVESRGAAVFEESGLFGESASEALETTLVYGELANSIET